MQLLLVYVLLVRGCSSATFEITGAAGRSGDLQPDETVAEKDSIAATGAAVLSAPGKTQHALVRRERPDGEKAVLLQQEHSLSGVSARWGGQVVYGIFTSSFQKYHNAMLTQLDTWAAKPYAEKRVVAMGGTNYPEEWKKPGSILASNCTDSGLTLACKESALIAEAAARGAAWVVLLGEDNWMNASAMDEFLQVNNPDEPQAFGLLGCGRYLKTFCEQVDKKGGFCGGGTYAISRAALKLLVANGTSNLTAEYTATTWPNDMTTSCALMRRHVTLRLLPHLHGSREIKDEKLMHLAKNRFSLHNIDEKTMRWLHAVTNGTDPQEVDRLHDLAFYKGCVRAANVTTLIELERKWQRCIAGDTGDLSSI